MGHVESGPARQFTGRGQRAVAGDAMFAELRSPNVMIERQYEVGAEPLGREGEIAVPRADIEHRFAAQIAESQVLQLGCE